jgi:hypothetical protein
MSGGVAQIAHLAATARLETWTLAVDDIRSWASTAPAGAELVYAREWHLNRHSPAAREARRLEKLGCVMMAQRGNPGQLKAYILQRLRPKRGVIGKPLKSNAPTLDGDMARLLRVLRLCAKQKRACPCNRELSREAKVHNPSYILQKLTDAKVVESVVIDRVTGLRRVTILATGEETALPAGWTA